MPPGRQSEFNWINIAGDVVYKLKIVVDKVEGNCNQQLVKGDFFYVDGGRMKTVW